MHSKRYKKSHKEIVYQPGDRVWVRNLSGQAGKLEPLWTGPCEVLHRVGHTGRYTVSFPDQIRDVHMERLKMYLPKVDGKKITLHYYHPIAKVPEDDNLIVEKILRHRVTHGRHQWLVRWKGYDASFDSWEPAESFVGYIQQDWLRFNQENHITIPIPSF